MERVVQEIECAIERRRLRAEVPSLRRRLAGRPRWSGGSARHAELRETIARVAPMPSPVLVVGESGTRQGAGRARAPPARRAARGAVRRHQLRRAAREPGRERALRPRAGRVHRRERHPEGRVRGGGAGDALPRRDRRAAARRRRPSCSACSRSAGSTRVGGDAAARRSRPGSWRRPTATSRPRWPAGRFRAGPVLPAQRAQIAGAAPPRAPERRAGDRRAVRWPAICAAVRDPPEADRAGRARRCSWRYEWPRNNVRELRNVVERMIIATDGEVIGPEQVPPEIRRRGRRAGRTAARRSRSSRRRQSGGS